MKKREPFVVVGCPLPGSFRADARVIGQLEAWRSKNCISYYPSSGAAEIGYDRIVKFARSIEPEPTHILFVDYDVLPRSNTLKKMLEHDKDIVCGTYPAVRKNVIEWCVCRDMDIRPFKLMDFLDMPDNMFKADIGSNGMMLAKMEVFDKIEWPYWRTQYEEDGSKIGADVHFFKKVKEAGIDVWVDPKLTCSHFKMVDLLGIAKNKLKGNTQ